VDFVALRNDLAVEVDVETLDFDLLAHPQADDHIDDLEDDESSDRRPGDGRERPSRESSSSERAPWT
jgi:hypothetical protein